MLTYTVVLIPEEVGGFSVEVPALSGCVTQVETKEEAMRVAREAISLYVESLKADEEEVPVERGVETAAVEIKEPVA